jgi:hypothetical protein
VVDQQVTVTATLLDNLSEPLAKIRGSLKGLGDGVKGLAGNLEPLANKFTIFATAVAGFASAKETIALAERQEKAELSLLNALGGREERLEKIKDITQEIESHSTTSNEVLLQQASLMKRVGLNADKIPQALQLAVDVAAGLDRNIELVSREIARIANGERSGLLTRLIPELEELEASGASAAEVFEALERRFKGAAGAIAGTDFGKILQAENELEERGKRIGKVLVAIKLAYVESLLPLIEKVTDFVESPQFALLSKFLESVAPALIKIGAGLAVLFAAAGALKVFNFVLPVLTSLFAIFSSIGSVIAAFGAEIAALVAVLGPFEVVSVAIGAALLIVVGIILQLTGVLDEVSDAVSTVFSGIFGPIGEVIGKISEGKLSVEDLFDVVKTRFRQFKTLLNAFILNPISKAISAVWKTVTSLITLVEDLFIVGVLTIVDNIQKNTLGALKFIATQVDSLLNQINGKLQQVDDAFGTSFAFGNSDFAGEFKDSIVDLQPSIDTLTDDIVELSGVVSNTLVDAWDDMRMEAVSALVEVASEEEDLNKRLVKSEKSIIDAKIDTVKKQVDLEKDKADKILAEAERVKKGTQSGRAIDQTVITTNSFFDVSEDQAKELLSKISKDLQNPVRQILISDLEDQLRRETISYQDYFRRRKALETDLLHSQIEDQDKVVALNQENLDALTERLDKATEVEETYKKLADAAREVGKPGEEVLGLELKAEEAAKHRTELAGELLDKTNDLRNSERKRLEFTSELIAKEQELRDVRVQVGGEVVSDLTRDTGDLKHAAELILEARKSGVTSITQAQADLNKLLDVYDRRLKDAKDDVANLLTTSDFGPTLDEDLSELNKKIKEISEGRTDIKLKLASSISEEIHTAQSELQDFFDDTDTKLEHHLILPEEAREANRAALADFKEALQAYVQLLIQLRDTTPEAAEELSKLVAEMQKLDKTKLPKNDDSGGFFEGVSQGAKKTAQELGNLGTLGEAVGGQLTAGLADGLIDTFVEAKQTFEEFAKSFIANILIMIAKALLLKAINSFLGAPVAANAGGPIGFDTGGNVPGPPVNRDVIDAKLTPGEWVIRRASSLYYGHAIMNAMNQRLIPREMFEGRFNKGGSVVNLKRAFATGGAAAAGSAGNVNLQPIVQAHVIADQQTFDRLLHGGDSAFQRYFRNNADTFNALLGKSSR